MIRKQSEPRRDWQARVESQGLYHHSIDGAAYWDESCYYQFSTQEIDQLEFATQELNELCLEGVEHVISNDLMGRMGIPASHHDWIRRSWDTDEHTLYGRFDFAYDGSSPPKLLEYNADTPTALLEASVIQWHWLKDLFPSAMQFNSIHERLLEAFMKLRHEWDHDRFWFTGIEDNLEDFMTVSYLRDLAMQAGFETHFLGVDKIGWNSFKQSFTDLSEEAITNCFKLYPWEWMFEESFSKNLLLANIRWFEPPWKSILSNKAILPILWKLAPDSPWLLEASFEPLDGDCVRKPFLSREGANIQFYKRGEVVYESPGPYSGEGIYQRTCLLPEFDDQFFPVVGSWMINGWASGIGIREDINPITGNTSRFVPHVMG